MLVVFLLVTVFSRRAIRPVIESMEKQKQFITDAGHEIKTPLAIISANTDVLELNNGPSEWTDSIRNQTKRLNGLVKNLLALSRLEEGTASLMFAEFSLSDAVWDAAAPFVTLAETRGKHLELCFSPTSPCGGTKAVSGAGIHPGRQRRKICRQAGTNPDLPRKKRESGRAAGGQLLRRAAPPEI